MIPNNNEVTMIYKRKCDECNNDYDALTPWARFCTDACKMKAYRRRKANNEAPIKQIAQNATGIPTARRKRKPA
jgi:ferredoxin